MSHIIATPQSHLLGLGLVLSPGGQTELWNFRSQELSLPGAKVPWIFRSRERKFHGTLVGSIGTKLPWNFRSQNC